jgi:predicted ATPase
LHDAVVDWLQYLGVAKAIVTRDQGKLGHDLRVTPAASEQLHDLTHVGVGVSQVLPIVVMALLAENDATLIFEQPELHLHPKVQTRLADFFLAMSLLGKQCLIETHSEYLVDRLRSRIAEATGDTMTHLARLYFTEMDDGATQCRPVTVNRYGVYEGWPEDFFDEAQRGAERLLLAGMRKMDQEERGE